MKKNFYFLMVSAFVFYMLLVFSGVGSGIEKEKDIKIEKYQLTKPTDNCGALEFDKKTGGMKRKPNVDLVVSKIEIVRNERGVWVTPWIMNRCPGIITEDIHVSIGDVVVTFGGLTPQVSKSLGHAIGMPPAASYTVIVDYNHRIAEADESNNSCTKSSTGNCP
jgi:hypothetical protein